MSKLRPTLSYGHTDYAPRGGTAYLMVLNAVKEKDGLLHGKLHDKSYSCAIGSYFDLHPTYGLYDELIDEVAAVNDSAPSMTYKQRKTMVTRWLRWKLKVLGVPGFARAKEPAHV